MIWLQLVEAKDVPFSGTVVSPSFSVMTEDEFVAIVRGVAEEHRRARNPLIIDDIPPAASETRRGGLRLANPVEKGGTAVLETGVDITVPHPLVMTEAEFVAIVREEAAAMRVERQGRKRLGIR